MQKKLLTNGNVFKRTDGRWCAVVWYMDEQGTRKRKSFQGTTKQEANKKITAYIAEFEKLIKNKDLQIEMGEYSYKLYKENFTLKKFNNNIATILKDICHSS